MERQRAQENIKKGPWTAEEDEILMNFVKENGSKDWSSIKSKGLLPRTGKSCRLRWVNKLQPNLKKGCKFSEEEERVVLELQATFGNKWAAIATYLPGRTDNDVKNFWSTRQKRLARILRASSQPNKEHKNKAKALLVDEVSPLQASTSSIYQVKKEASLQCHICSCFCTENANAITMLPPLVDEHTDPPQLCIQSSNNRPSTSFPIQNSLSTENIHKPAVSNLLPLMQENLDFGMQLGEPNFMDAFTKEEDLELGNMGRHNLGLSLEELEVTDQNFGGIVADYKDKMMTMPDNQFGDLSDDMLDNQFQSHPPK
ncbi:hypothetical protein ACH5RR_038737 [Cinchona calisaya]|uniref:Uncharacterized protein n=1 Tax=Cinchona calisaya TaxID=153742 RepID=A0ABD2XZM5_9GENT